MPANLRSAPTNQRRSGQFADASTSDLLSYLFREPSLVNGEPSFVSGEASFIHGEPGFVGARPAS